MASVPTKVRSSAPGLPSADPSASRSGTQMATVAQRLSQANEAAWLKIGACLRPPLPWIVPWERELARHCPLAPSFFFRSCSVLTHGPCTLRVHAGNVSEALSDVERAAMAYDNALRHNPFSIKALMGLGNILRRREIWPRVRPPSPAAPLLPHSTTSHSWLLHLCQGRADGGVVCVGVGRPSTASGGR